MTRSRSYSWEDPRALLEAVASLDGLAFLNKIGSGDLPAPPAAATTGINPIEVGEGWARFLLEPAEWQYNPMGTVHGGILSTLADTALACAIHTQLPAGVGYTSLDLTIKFTRPATVDRGALTCEGRVVTLGRRTATAEGTITDADGKVVAHAVTTCLLFAVRGEEES